MRKRNTKHIFRISVALYLLIRWFQFSPKLFSPVIYGSRVTYNSGHKARFLKIKKKIKNKKKSGHKAKGNFKIFCSQGSKQGFNVYKLELNLSLSFPIVNRPCHPEFVFDA